MARDTDPYVPSEAVTSHPFWLKSVYWRVICRAPWCVHDLRRYLKQREGNLDDVSFEIASFYAALRFDLDRIEGRRNP